MIEAPVLMFLSIVCLPTGLFYLFSSCTEVSSWFCSAVTVNRLKLAKVLVLNLTFQIVKVMPTPIEELIFSDDEHDEGGTNDIKDNVLGDTFNEEHPKEVELEESLPESRRAPLVLDVETEGEAHSSNEENTDDEDEYEGVEEVILKDPIYKEEARAGTGGGEDTAPGPSTSQNLLDGASITSSRRRYDNEFNFKSSSTFIFKGRTDKSEEG